MNYKEELIERLENKTAKIGVLGLGYVGLPLAVEKAKAGYKVIGFDVQEDKVRKINNGINYIGDVIPEDLEKLVENNSLRATNDFRKISEVDALAICVPTPLDIYKQPNMDYVKASAESVAKYMTNGILVVLESTTYPGTTEEIIKTAIEEQGFIVGENSFIAYSPERVDPGNQHFNTKNTPKVVGGVTDSCTKVASTLYRNVLDGEVHEVSSPAVAEMEKLLENTFRNINIALANEMAILCEKMNIDVWEVIDAAATKPYGFMPFYPGPGIGGHCIPIDPWYLTYKAREVNYHTKLIETAGEINDEMPQFIVDKILHLLNLERKPLNQSKILVLGVAYKKNIDDARESPILPILTLLEKNYANFKVCDPHIKSFIISNNVYNTVEVNVDLIKEADIVLIATNHDAFDYEMIMNNAKLILDTRNSYKIKNIDNYHKI
ncbi:MAG TPA: UDP-N-acetyl-D-glucosamine dehydrogenase [Jeotgalicoccus sp.]|nr:UDP-N-acetyl-D-glucosamine dehydrogenase [Jeotgalicoccus sp.]